MQTPPTSSSGRHPQPDTKPDKVQAKAPDTQTFGAEAFDATDATVLRWLGMAGFLINSRGTTIMIDPLLRGL